jgi:DNA-binding NtrC family response regulator
MKKMLIVDDSRNWLEYHAQAVRELFGGEFTIDMADSAKRGFEKVTANLDEPYDVILTDMQMEIDFSPLYAGEWLVKQIQFYKEYADTKIIIISATSNIRQIAEKYKIGYIPKYACRDLGAYKKAE